jgi:hypothetical protein
MLEGSLSFQGDSVKLSLKSIGTSLEYQVVLYSYIF